MKADLVVDTNVLSFLFRQDSRAEAYLPYLENKAIAISFQTMAELELWALVGQWGSQRKARLAEFIAHFGVVAYSQRLGQQWAEATFSARRQGKPIGSADAWIAATALELQTPLVTHNPADFAGVKGFQVISTIK